MGCLEMRHFFSRLLQVHSLCGSDTSLLFCSAGMFSSAGSFSVLGLGRIAFNFWAVLL